MARRVMMNRRNSGGVFPTPEQELLLRAALLSGEPALRALREWKSRVLGEADLDEGSYRLLPLLYVNLQRLGVDDPAIGRLKDIYRREWYKNRMLFHTARDVLCLFHAAGIETMILKGGALALLHYKDYGARAMNDFDVLVPIAKRRAAIDVLVRAGWKPITHAAEKMSDPVLDVRNGWGFENAKRQQFDLHWYVMVDCRYPDADDDFWSGSIPLEVGKVSTRALNPTDQLLHVIVHGAKWNTIPPIRWVADAMTVLNASGGMLDWSRLVKQAEKHHVSLPLRKGLLYLITSMDAAIPAPVLMEMDNIRVSKIEYRSYRVITEKPNWLGGIPAEWFHYSLDLEARGKSGLVYQLVTFPGHLREVRVMTRRQFLRWIITRAAVRIGSEIRGLDQGLQ